VCGMISKSACIQAPWHGKYQALAEMAHSYSACVWCIAHMDTLPSKKKG